MYKRIGNINKEKEIIWDPNRNFMAENFDNSNEKVTSH